MFILSSIYILHELWTIEMGRIQRIALIASAFAVILIAISFILVVLIETINEHA